MEKLNCWEFKHCGRELNGRSAHELGVCPVAMEKRLDGIHGGQNAGRACWVVPGSMCNDRVQGIYAHKKEFCTACDFYHLVKKQELPGYILTPILLRKLRWS